MLAPTEILDPPLHLLYAVRLLINAYFMMDLPNKKQEDSDYKWMMLINTFN